MNKVTYNGNERFIRAEGEIFRNYYIKETLPRNMEIDIYGKSETGEEVFIEIKLQGRKSGVKNIEKFLRLKSKFDNDNRNFLFIFFSVEGFTSEAQKRSEENGIYYGDIIKYPVI